MGLNLSIKRVVFSALRKYDGKQTRDLTAQEIKQIGGRAGRYGHHENGIVAVLGEAGTPAHIRKMLAAPPEPITELRPLVQPDSDIVRAVAEEIETDSLYGVLVRIKRAVLRADDPNYRLADMDQAFEIASALEGVEGLSLTQRWSMRCARSMSAITASPASSAGPAITQPGAVYRRRARDVSFSLPSGARRA